MDGLDVYIDDYSKPDADRRRGRCASWSRPARSFDPPRTRVNEQGTSRTFRRTSRRPRRPRGRRCGRRCTGRAAVLAPPAEPSRTSVAEASRGAGRTPAPVPAIRAGRSRTLGRAARAGADRFAVPPMSLAGKKLLLCSCNGTMPLDGRRSRARSTCLPRRRCARCSARRSWAASPTARARRRGRRVHAGSAPVRRRRRGGRQGADDPLRQHPRDGGLVGRGARPRRRRSPRCWRWRRCPSPMPVPSVAYRSRRPAADRRPARRGAALGRGARRHARRHGAGHRAHGRRRAAGRARVSRSTRARSTRSTAGSARSSRMDAGQSDRPRSVHALQRLHQRLPRAGDRLELPDRSRPLQARIARAWPPAARSAAIDFARRDARAQRALRPRARSAAHAAVRACTSRRRATSRRAPTRSRRRRRWPSSRR